MNHNPSSNPNIDSRELLDSGEQLHLLDVREPIEYHTYNIGGVNIPLGNLAAQTELLPWHKNQEVIVICQAGLRSQTAQAILQQHGYLNIRNLTGGLLAVRKQKR